MVHLALGKMYVLPVVLAAIWFGLRGALIAALAVTLLYIQHIVVQWAGEQAVSINLWSELATTWVTAVLTGVFAGREKAVLRRLAAACEGTVRALVAALDGIVTAVTAGAMLLAAAPASPASAQTSSPAAGAHDMPDGADNFYKSDRVTVQKVSFKNQYQMTVAGNLFTPKDLNRDVKHAAIVVGQRADSKPPGSGREDLPSTVAPHSQSRQEQVLLLRLGTPAPGSAAVCETRKPSRLARDRRRNPPGSCPQARLHGES
jgi:hypothetical protein